MTRQGQPETLHRRGDDGARSRAQTTPRRPAAPKAPSVRSITRGKAEEATRPPASHGCNSREGEPTKRANRCFVVGSDGIALSPCSVQRAAKLRKQGRARLYLPEPYTIILLDRKASDPDLGVFETEVRIDPGSRHTGIAVVMKLPKEDRIVHQGEIQHRGDITKRLLERKGHRRRRRGNKWFRKRRFDNRTRSANQLPPSLESVVSNQTHRAARLAELAGSRQVVVETAKVDTQKALSEKEIKGVEYQQGALYRTHLRAFIAERDRHRCAYCGKGDWEDRTRFNLDHVHPRAHGGATNVRNLVWSCGPCNREKGAEPVETFLKGKPERLARILGRKRQPLAAAGRQKWLCDTLVKRLRAQNLRVIQTTGADTAATRRKNGIAKSHANDAACAGAKALVTQLRKPVYLRAVGHGRRKQIKALPIGDYLAWRHLKPSQRRRQAAPRHAAHPHTVHGIRTRDRVRIRISRPPHAVTGLATVYAKTGTIRVYRPDGTSLSTKKRSAVRRIRGKNGYRHEPPNQT